MNRFGGDKSKDTTNIGGELQSNFILWLILAFGFVKRRKEDNFGSKDSRRLGLKLKKKRKKETEDCEMLAALTRT